MAELDMRAAFQTNSLGLTSQNAFCLMMCEHLCCCFIMILIYIVLYIYMHKYNIYIYTSYAVIHAYNVYTYITITIYAMCM